MKSIKNKNIKSHISIKKLILCQLICLLLISVSTNSSATSDSLHISKQNWQKTIGKTDYTETFKTPQLKRNFNFNPSFGWINSDTSRIVITIIIIGILLLLLFLILKNKVFNIDKKINKQTIYQEFSEDAHINELDLEKIFEKLMQEKKYRFAIRIRFLMALKTLINNELIIWEKDKSNGDYIRELSKTDLVNNFIQLVMIYERIWFSEIEITASDFRILDKVFTKFNTALKKDE